MKKIFFGLLMILTVFVMVFSVAACNNNDDAIKELNDRIEQLERDLADAKNQVGINGEDGKDGVNSLYVTFKECYPYYSGSEAQWAEDFLNGKLAFTFGLEFTLTDALTYEVSKGSATADNIIIPSIFNGIPVTSIADRGFRRMFYMKNITIPDSVGIIGAEAFEDCTKLTSITIPSSVVIIDYLAFSACTSLKNMFFENGSKLKTIGCDAFFMCESLTSITIPASVTSVAQPLISRCNSLVTLEVEDGNTVYRSEENCLIRIADNMIVAGCKNSVIPGSVTGIDEYAFHYCTTLESIDIPDNITYIGDYSFEECSNLKTIVIPASVTDMGRSVFSHCFDLEEVIFEKDSKLEIISASMFFDCLSLKSVALPASAKIIDSYVFDYCYELTDIFYGGADAAEWDLVEIDAEGNEALASATIYYYSETEVLGGTHWRYVSGVPVIWE